MYRPVLSSESFICLTYRLYAAPMKSFTTPWAPDARDRRWKTVEICSTTRKGTILAKEGSETHKAKEVSHGGHPGVLAAGGGGVHG